MRALSTRPPRASDLQLAPSPHSEQRASTQPSGTHRSRSSPQTSDSSSSKPPVASTVHPSPRSPVDTTLASTIPVVADRNLLWYKQSIPVCFGRFEFHAEWLRDEPFDATTTGQNKGVPVSTLSCETRGEHEIRSIQPKRPPRISDSRTANQEKSQKAHRSSYSERASCIIPVAATS
jgi:hypothetical protein